MNQEIKNNIKVLQQAHKLLEQSKWIRGEYTLGGGTYCAMGAVHAYTSSINSLAETVLDDVADGNIVEFNDEIAREKRDVLRKFRRAINKMKTKKFQREFENGQW